MESAISRTTALAAAILLAATTGDCAAGSGEKKVESSSTSAGAAAASVAPEKMPAIATVDERYQSYNIEMAELTGGQFWKPYDKFPAGWTPPSSALFL